MFHDVNCCFCLFSGEPTRAKHHHRKHGLGFALELTSTPHIITKQLIFNNKLLVRELCCKADERHFII